MQKILFLLLMFLSYSLKLSAITDTSNLLHFNMDNGFPSNNVYSLLQDRYGYLWFATDNGVVKYNGYSFKIFNTSDGLPGNDVWQLYEDSHGRIWFHSYAYTFGYVKNDVYRNLSLKTDDRVMSPLYITDNGQVVSFLYNDKDARLVLAHDDVLGILPLSSLVPERLWASDPTPGVTLARDGTVLLFEKGKVYTVDIINRKAILLCDVLYDYGRYFSFNKYTVSPEREVYAFDFNGWEIDHLDLKKCAYRTVSLKDLGATQDEVIYGFSAYYTTKNPDERSVFITNSHIYIFDKHLAFLKRLAIKDIIPTQAQVAYILKDKNNDEWYTTNGDGVWKTSQSQNIFSVRNNLPQFNDAKLISSADGANSYWWNKRNRHIYKLNGNETLDSVRVPFATEVTAVTEYGNKLIICAIEKTYSYDPVERKFSDFIDKNTIHLFNDKKVDSDDLYGNNYWARRRQILTHDSILYSIARTGWIRFRVNGDSVITHGLSEERYSHIYLDTGSSILWIYNDQKILQYDIVSGKSIILNNGLLKVLGINTIRQIVMDSFKNVYVLDNDKILVYNKLLNRVIRLPAFFTLTDAMLSVCRNNLLVAGRFGVAIAPITGPGVIGQYKVVPNKYKAYYNKVYDFQVGNTGDIVMVTDRGAFGFNIDSIRPGDILRPSGDDFLRLILKTPFEKIVNAGDTLNFRQGFEKLQFDAVNFNGKGTVRYEYRISGKHWESNISGEIFIGSLEADNFYRVKCIISDELWRSKPFTFYIYREPYWYQTVTWKTFFWVSGTVLFVVLVLVIIWVTKTTIARKNEKRRVLTELELRAIHSQINPHFIFNTLSTALYFINKKRFDDAYVHVSKFSRLLRSYLKASHDRYTILGDEIQMLRNYIELQQTRFEHKFTYRIEIDNKIPVNNIQIPSLLLQPLIENAINHGLFHLEGNGELILKFQQGGDNAELICVIEDNGVGREKAKEINDASSTKDSYGTKLTNQLLEVFKEYEHMNIFIEYTDKKEPETGTIVTLIIKKVRYIA